MPKASKTWPRIINYTSWRTGDLRKLFVAGLKDAGATLERSITVRDSEVRHHRHIWADKEKTKTKRVLWHNTYGRAKFLTHDVEGAWIRMWIPSPESGHTEMASIARVFEHEVAHTLGVRHQEMDRNVQHCWGDLPEWAEGIDVHAKQERTKVRLTGADHAASKLAHCMEMIETHEKKKRTITRLIKKWSDKKRYYKKRLEKLSAAGGTQ